MDTHKVQKVLGTIHTPYTQSSVEYLVNKLLKEGPYFDDFIILKFITELSKTFDIYILVYPSFVIAFYRYWKNIKMEEHE